MRGGALACLAGVLLGGIAPARAEDPATPPSIPLTSANEEAQPNKPPKTDIRYWMMEDLLKMSEFIDTTIPGTLMKYKLVFSLSPRFADARKGEFIRLPVELRYGLSNRWEIDGGLTPYCPNPINSGKEHRWGTGEGKLGVRYDWGHWGTLFEHVTIGIEGRIPLGTPPIDLIDYYTHVIPFINTSRPLPWKYTTLYTNLGYDRSLNTPFRANVPRYDPSLYVPQEGVPPPPPPRIVRRNVFAVTPSVLYKPGEFGGFVEYSWRHIEDEVLGTHLGHEIKVGPIWDVPLWRTQSWGLPGKWQVEFAERITFEEGRKTSHGEALRVRWRTTLREVFTKKSYERIPHP
jgi:hypothetical protein